SSPTAWWSSSGDAWPRQGPRATSWPPPPLPRSRVSSASRAWTVRRSAPPRVTSRCRRAPCGSWAQGRPALGMRASPPWRGAAAVARGVPARPVRVAGPGTPGARNARIAAVEGGSGGVRLVLDVAGQALAADAGIEALTAAGWLAGDEVHVCLDEARLVRLDA